MYEDEDMVDDYSTEDTTDVDPSGLLDGNEEYTLDDLDGPEVGVHSDMDSPTDFDEYEMNPEDCDELDAGDPYDCEYDGQPDEAQEWHDFDPDC